MADLDNSEGIVQTPFKRVRYVEPNYTTSINMQGSRGLHSYEFENPLEDYCIFVNLKVEVRGREIRTDYTSDSQTWTLNYYSQQGKESVSFLQGSKYPNKNQNVYGKDVYSLTTDYDRHIYLNDIVKKDDSGNIIGTDASTELFGINSIDIQYNNWMVPVVTIKFTDIRGAALFSPEEARHNREDSKEVGGVADTSIEGSFFKCFFTFPYPKFTLCIKGFYGQPVGYELTCSDFRASFNSSSGNFEATAKFIGYSFSFLGDVMMNALTAAPFSDYLGKKYWDANVGNRFTVKDNNGQDVPMMTLGEFVSKIDSALSNANGIVASSPAGQENVELNKNKDDITNITNAYNAFLAAFKDAGAKTAAADDDIAAAGFQLALSDKGTVVVVLPSSNGKKFYDQVDDDDNVKEAYKSLQTVAKDTKYADQIAKLDPKNLQSQDIYMRAAAVYTLNPKLNDLPESIKNALRHNSEIDVNLRKGKSIDEGLMTQKSLFYGWVIRDNDFTSTLESDKTENDTQMEKNQEEISIATNQAISDCLGFTPSIENLTRMIMAHFETLNYMITMCAREITESKRTMSSLGVTDTNITDVNVSKEDTVIPPFPRLTKHVTEEGVDKNEEAWIGDFNGDWVEKNLVNGILNGINEMAKIIQSQEPYQGTEGGSLSAIMKIPLSPLDLLLDKNPYGTVDFNNKSDFAGHVILRMFNILGLSSKFQGDGLTEIGKAEAVNFNDFFPNPPDEFKQWINDENIVKTIEDITLCSGNISVNDYGKGGKFAWENGKVNNNADERKKTRHALMFNWTLSDFVGEKVTYVPVQDTTFTKVANDLNAPDAKYVYHKHPNHDADYIITYPTVDINKKVRYSSNKLICIESNPDRFSTILNKQDNDMPNLRDAMLGECTYNGKEYGDNFQHTDYVISYQNTMPVISSGEEGDDNQQTTSTGEQQDDNAEKEKMSQEYAKNNAKGLKVNSFDDWVKSYGTDGFKNFIADSGYTVDNYKILFIPGVKLDGDIDEKQTLYTQEKYYNLDIYGKAFLYLRSLSYYVKYDECINAITDKDTTFTTIPLASILYAGALCYYENADKTDLKKCVKEDILTAHKLLFDLRVDIKYDLETFFTKWVKDKYTKIDSFLSLKCDIKAFNQKIVSINSFFNTSNSDIESLMSTYLPGMQAIYECVDGDTHYKLSDGYVGIRLGLKPSGYGAISAAEVVLSPYTFMKSCDCAMNPKKEISIENGEAYLTGFFDKLKELYSTTADNNSNVDTEIAADCQTDNDIKIGVYRYLKLLYDKWIAGSVFENDFKMEKFFGTNPDTTSADDRYFYFIDSYYNKIGNKILVNVEKVKDQIINCEVAEGSTLLSFLSEMYAANRCLFLCVQNFMDLSDEENMKKVFQPVSFMNMDPPKVTPNFIVMYTYEPSSHLDLGDTSEFQDDSFSIKEGPSTSNKYPKPLMSGEESGYNIPAFGVSYGKMYQSYFKDISLNMEDAMVTDQAIKAQFEIASMNNENEKNTGNTGSSTRSMITMGQDLFTIYSNQSFSCEVEMMGDAWIQPLMYFELLNIPMFKGTYLIEKVTHHIEAGNMTTHFKGVRMANTTTKIKKGWFFMADPTQDGEESIEDREHELANVTNDCEYAQFPVGEGSIAGLLCTQNGVSALNYFEAGNNLWYKKGDTGKNLGDGAGTTCGPGLTRNYLKHGTSAAGLIQGFKEALKDTNASVQKFIKGKQFSKKAIDSLFHARYWIGNLGSVTGTNDAGLAQWWVQKAESGKSEYPGWEGFCKGWAWIITGREPNFNRNDQKTRAKDGYNAYLTPNIKLLKTLGFITPPTANDTTKKDGKDKGIWEDFANAVNQSAMATPSCGLNVSEQPIDKNSGYLFDMSAIKGHSDKLGIVFDIILNTYSSYIQELWWVALNKNDVNGPNRLKVVVSKKPVFGKIKVGMLINTGITGNGSNKFKFTEEAGAFKGITKNSNQMYRRAIVKFYSKNGRHNEKDENQGVYGKVVQSKILKTDWNDLKPQACSELLGGGEGGENFVPSKPIGDGKFDAGKAANYLMSHYGNIKISSHNCAAAVQMAIGAGGLNHKNGSGYKYAKDTTSTIGFQCILHGTTDSTSYQSYIKSPILGDVMGMTKGNDKNYVGHVCMFCGKENGWCSDFHQDNAYVYPGSGPGEFWVMRYKGKA